MKFHFEGLDTVGYDDEVPLKKRLEDFENPEVINDDGQFADVIWKTDFEADSVEEAKQYVSDYLDVVYTAFSVRDEEGNVVFTEDDL